MSDANPYPEIYLLGAPKCGTTAMYDNLIKHPGIGEANLKEPAYFASDLPNARVIEDERQYLKLYAGRGHHLVIDASTTYFYSQQAIGAILKQRPDAKFLIILRNPADMVFSLHNQQRLSLHEPEADFSVAWDDSDRRWAGGWQKMHHVPPVVCYKQAGKLGHYVSAIKDQLPNDQLHIMLLEDFRSDFRGTYTRLLEFLRLPDDGRTEWTVSNPASERKFRRLYRFFLSSYGPMGPVKRAKKRIFGLQNTQMMQKLDSASVRPMAEKKRLKGEMRERVLAHYEEDIIRLEQLLGRSLQHWRA